MAVYFENIGLDMFTETEEDFESLIKYVVSEGSVLKGYSEDVNYNIHFGWAQIIASLKSLPDGSFEFVRMDTHADGHSIWKLRIFEDISKNTDCLTKKLLVTRGEDGSGMAVVNVVNADVLPSFLKDDIYEFQMIAFPESIEYFETEEEYEESLVKDELGRTFGIANGSILPTGFINNHSVNSEQCEENDWMDDYVFVRGTVKKILYGCLEFGEEEVKAYIRCIIDTQYGELELNHTIDQVDEIQRKNMKVGANVVAVCVLSAEADIQEYSEGIVKNEENNLKLLRYTFVKGYEERLKSVLDENVIYDSKNADMIYKGVDNVISRIKYVKENTNHEYFAHMAIITEIDEGEDPLDYGVGKRCVVLAIDEPDNYESIVFIDMNDEGSITRINLSKDSRYHFKLDSVPYKVDADEFYVMEDRTYANAIIIRAKYMTFLDYDIDDEILIERDSYYSMDVNNAKRMLDSWPDEISEWNENEMELLFGYLFAKSIEYAYSFILLDDDNENMCKPLVGYRPYQAWKEEYDSEYEHEIHEKLKVAMKYGKQFYKDYSQYYMPGDEGYKENLIEALALVQRIGRYCAKEYLEIK